MKIRNRAAQPPKKKCPSPEARSAARREGPAFPMRINRYLAERGFATRRAADELIVQGRVSINGRRAALGDKVEESDTVDVRGAALASKNFVYAAYHKPQGVITHSPQEGERDIREALANARELRGTFPVGRLDKASHGLILLTNDGRVTDRLLNPAFDHEKEYEVTTQEPLRPSFKERMEAGVDIGGYVTRRCKVQILGGTTFRVTLGEGKKHQVRRMVSALHNTVVDLKRVRILNLELGSLPEGQYRILAGKELSVFLQKLGLAEGV